MRPRVTILALMGGVAVFALGAVALREANEAWASVVFTLTLGILGLACLGAAFRRGRSRAAFAGFAAFGVGYMFLCFGPWASTEVRSHLLTSWAIDQLPEPLPRAVILKVPDDDTVIGEAGNLSYTVSGFQRWPTFPSSGLVVPPAHRQRVGHSLFALLAGIIGGLAARYFYDTRTPQPPAPGGEAP